MRVFAWVATVKWDILKMRNKKMGHHSYKLEGRKIVACTVEECRDMGHRVALTKIGPVEISTVFLAINHGFSSDSVPLVFETMIFGGKFSGYCERYSTWQDAEEGHKRAKAMVLHEHNRNKLWTKIVDKIVLLFTGK